MAPGPDHLWCGRDFGLGSPQGDMAKRPRFAAGDRRFAPINAALGFESPFRRVPAAKKRVVDIFPLPSHLDARTWTRHDRI
jgi:hypothetical protein